MPTHLFGGVLRAPVGVVCASVSGKISLHVSSSTFQGLGVTGGEPVSVELPQVGPSDGFYFVITNIGPPESPDLVLTDGTSTVTTVGAGRGTVVACDGACWYVALQG